MDKKTQRKSRPEGRPSQPSMRAALSRGGIQIRPAIREAGQGGAGRPAEPARTRLVALGRVGRAQAGEVRLVRGDHGEVSCFELFDHAATCTWIRELCHGWNSFRFGVVN